MRAEAEEEYCRTCGKPKSDHPYRHMFIGVKDSPALVEVKVNTPAPPDSVKTEVVTESGDKVKILPPGDSVLRMALLRAGVITLADLEAIEAELKGAGIAWHVDDPAVG